MTTIYSLNVATAAAKAAPQAAGVNPGSANSQVANPGQVAQTSQALANGVAAQLDLSNKKAIQLPSRAESAFDPQEEKEKSDAGKEQEELDAETPYRTLKSPVDVVA